MYLEQELESLKAVLEIKNEKLHQQDVKLMKMEKLVRFCQRLPQGPASEEWEPTCDLELGAVVTAPEAVWKCGTGKRGSISFSVLAPGWPLLPSATLFFFFPSPRNW